MIRTTIEDGFKISLPESVRTRFAVGETVLIDVDEHGRIVMVPASAVLAILDQSFGMRQAANSAEDEGIRSMDWIRKGQRID